MTCDKAGKVWICEGCDRPTPCGYNATKLGALAMQESFEAVCTFDKEKRVTLKLARWE